MARTMTRSDTAPSAAHAAPGPAPAPGPHPPPTARQRPFTPNPGSAELGVCQVI